MKKRTDILLMNGKKKSCWKCKNALISTTKQLTLTGKGSFQDIKINEEILFCENCHHYFVTKDMCLYFVKKYPHHYLDLTQYTIKPVKKKVQQVEESKNLKRETVTKNQKSIEYTDYYLYNADNNYNMTTPVNDALDDIPLFLVDSIFLIKNCCPQCRTLLASKKINLPFENSNGDFLRYYVEKLAFCENCCQGYVDRNTINSILKRLQVQDDRIVRVKLHNFHVTHDKRDLNYLHYPTANLETSIVISNESETNPSIPSSFESKLNSQSFLGEMGYSTQKSSSSRRSILIKAVKEYGKRKVADHIAFLIETRKRQNNGQKRYATALKIWQDDLNFITSLQE